ncbi:MAG TPA: histone deacetylase family protein [Actinomycetes bacterium]|nr:histone deacetylase family protein [Actinomycetes bacterium]
MEPMPVVASDQHALHDPPYEVNYGTVVRPVYERVARGERLRAALAAAGHPLLAPAGHGLGPVLAVHDRDLVEFLEGAWAGWRAAGGGEALIPDTFPLPRMAGGGPRELAGPLGRPGWYCFDTATPLVAGSWRAARAAVDVALGGAELLADGAAAAYALCRPPGHHAGPGYYGGFCLLNNAAVAARWLARLGRVAVVDVDFHHGNGTQDVFWEDPAVLYVSLHGDPARHYPPFSGAADERGGGPGAGATRNFPLADGTGDDDYLAALAAAAEVVAAFDPATLVVSLGFDTFQADPIGAFALTTGGYRRIGGLLAELGRPTLIVQEGGYAIEALGDCAVAALAGFQAARISGPG